MWWLTWHHLIGLAQGPKGDLPLKNSLDAKRRVSLECALYGAFTQQLVCGANQCMDTAMYMLCNITLWLCNTLFILHCHDQSSLYSFFYLHHILRIHFLPLVKENYSSYQTLYFILETLLISKFLILVEHNNFFPIHTWLSIAFQKMVTCLRFKLTRFLGE